MDPTVAAGKANVTMMSMGCVVDYLRSLEEKLSVHLWSQLGVAIYGANPAFCQEWYYPLVSTQDFL